MSAVDRFLGGLTVREAEVVVLVAEGMSNAEISAATVHTVQTTKFHVGNAMRKCGVANRGQLAAVLWRARVDDARYTAAPVGAAVTV